MKKGDIVTPKHNKRSKFMNKEFRNWVTLHKGDRFFVLSVKEGCVRLSKVHFMITTDFLDIC